MDVSSGGGVGSSALLACDDRPLAHSPQLLPASLLFAAQRPHGGGDRRLPPVIGPSPGLCLFPVLSDLPGPVQAPVQLEHSSDAYSSSLASERVVSGPSASVGGSSYRPTFTSQSAQTTTCPSSAPEPPHATASCVETVERFARHLGLFHRVARQLSLCRRPSSRKLYQHHWEVYRRWCAGRGYSVSSLSIAKVTDFLLFLRKERHLSVPSIRGFWAALSSVFKFVLPEIRENFILWDLIRSFELERPLSPVVPPSWDLVRVFSFLRGSSFEPLSSCSLHQLMMKVLFLLSLVTAKRVGKLQALSRCVIFCGPDLSVLPSGICRKD